MKKVVISSCSHCPYFDNYYYSFSERCTLLDRKKIIDKDTATFQIPSDCPLEDTDEELLDNDKITEK